MNNGLKAGLITLVCSVVLAIPASIIDLANGGRIVDTIGNTFRNISDSNKKDIVINQLNNSNEIYTVLDTKDKNIDYDYSFEESYNDFKCEIITNINPKIVNKDVYVPGAFGLRMNFNLDNDHFDDYEDEVFLSSIQRLLGSNMVYTYEIKTFYADYYVVDLSNSYIYLEKINEDNTSEIMVSIDSMDAWNQIVKYKTFTIKKEDGTLFYDIGKYRISIILKEYEISRASDNSASITNFKIHSWSKDIYLNSGEYENSILLPVDGIKEKNYFQVNVVDYDKSKLYISNTSKINISDLFSFGVCYDGNNSIKNVVFDFYYYDSKLNKYTLVKIKEIFKKFSCKEKVLIDSQGFESGKYKIVLSGKLNQAFKKSIIVEETYEYYFDINSYKEG